MRVLFVVSKTHEWPRPGYPHAGIAYLVAMLRQTSHRVKIIDMRLGYGFAHLSRVIDEFNPDIVGVTSYSYLYRNAYEVIDRVKSHGDHIVVIGGSHVSSIRNKILAETRADFAVKGEGEYTLLELCEAIETGVEDFGSIKGLIWRRENEVIENADRPYIKDLDSLPFPAFEEFELEQYGCYVERRLPIITSRGCPNRCIFCAVRTCMGNRFRARSPENVVDEIEYWYKKGFRNFDINDDCFTFDMKRAAKICDLILERGLKITYCLYNGIRVDRVSEELLKKMKDSGCSLVQYGIESGNKEVLRKIKKGITVERARKAVMLAKKAGIPCVVNFIIGHPGEDLKKALDSIELAKTLPVDSVCFYNLVPYPGTELFNWVKDNAKLLHPPEVFLNRISYGEEEPIFETNEFPVKDRKKVLRKGLLLYRKKVLQFRFGRNLGCLAYLPAKSNILWELGINLYQLILSRILHKIFNFNPR